MDTPICDFVNSYANSSPLRLHMPGHKGIEYLGYEKYDITEIDGADTLYSGDGIILKSEKNASKLFCTQKTLYSTEGSSLSIKAMLYLAYLYAKSKNQKPTILAFRNVHKSFINGASLLDIDVNWIYPETFSEILSCIVSTTQLEKEILNQKILPTAVYVTSPDYLGNIADIEGYSKICKKYNILLLVDNAHGAYLAFSQKQNHPIKLGADICCDSAHKTLPVITGGGYLQISKQAPKIILDNAESAMQLFASTSPSYLIMASLDNFNGIANDFKDKLNNFEKLILKLKQKLISKGYDLVGNETLKITIKTKPYGYIGKDFATILLSKKIVCEFYDNDFIVMMFSPYIKNNDLDKITETLLNIPQKTQIEIMPPKQIKAKKILSIKDAMLNPSKTVKVDNALGKVLASANISCPPAIPIAIAGEEINKECIEALKYYGIEECKISIIK